MTLAQKASRIARLARRRNYPEVVALLLCLTALGLGTTMLTHPHTYQAPTYGPAMDFASPQAWGVAFIVTAVIFAAAVLAYRAVAIWPAIILTGLWSIWAVCMILGATDGGVPSPAIVYTTLSWLTLGLVAVYWNDSRTEED